MNVKVVSSSVYVGKSLIEITETPFLLPETLIIFFLLVKGIGTAFKMNKIRFLSWLYSLLFLSCLCFLLCFSRVMGFHLSTVFWVAAEWTIMLKKSNAPNDTGTVRAWHIGPPRPTLAVYDAGLPTFMTKQGKDILISEVLWCWAVISVSSVITNSSRGLLDWASLAENAHNTAWEIPSKWHDMWQHFLQLDPESVQHPRLWLVAYDVPNSASYPPQYSEPHDSSEGACRHHYPFHMGGWLLTNSMDFGP